MIDLDELHDKMVSYRLVGFTKSDIGTIDALELLGRLEQAEKDAARYQWLMENCGKILEPARNRTHLYLPNYCPLSMDYVDVSKHIDEAMQCNK